MLAYWGITLSILTIVLLGVEATRIAGPDTEKIRINVYATNLMVYHQTVVNYATQNPAAIGNVSESALGLPTWFQNMGWTNDITASGIARSYRNTAISAQLEANLIAGELAQLTHGRWGLGVTTATNYIHPGAGVGMDASISAGIPAGLPFIATKIR